MNIYVCTKESSNTWMKLLCEAGTTSSKVSLQSALFFYFRMEGE